MVRRLGYAPIDLGTLCEFIEDADSMKCAKCGIRISKRVAGIGKPFVVCRAGRETRSTVAANQPPDASTASHEFSAKKAGLGDRLASALNAVGITKDRVQAVASKVGVKDCGCKQRQQKLNELGQKYLGIGREPS